MMKMKIIRIIEISNHDDNNDDNNIIYKKLSHNMKSLVEKFEQE